MIRVRINSEGGGNRFFFDFKRVFSVFGEACKICIPYFSGSSLQVRPNLDYHWDTSSREDDNVDEGENQEVRIREDQRAGDCGVILKIE